MAYDEQRIAVLNLQYTATKFRIWATQILKEYMQKGFAMDDERLKQGKTFFGKDYFLTKQFKSEPIY